MVKKTTRAPAVTWAGSEIEVPWSISSTKRNDAEFYRSCVFGSLILTSGDFILVSNTDAADPDIESECDVAQLQYLYETNLDPDLDPFRAVVKWYSRPAHVPKKCNAYTYPLDHDHEVIEELRPFDNDISIETILRKCDLIFTDTDLTPGNLIKHNTKEHLMYVCRFKLIRHGSKYIIVPRSENINDAQPLQNHNKNRTPKTPKLSSNQTPSVNFTPNGNLVIRLFDNSKTDADTLSKVSPIKIINQTVQKVHKNGNEKGVQPVTSASRKSKKIQEQERTANCLENSPKTELDGSFEKSLSARRNLCHSLNNNVNQEDLPNYSIVKESPKESNQEEIKIKLRLSQKRNSVQTPCTPNTALRRSSRKRSVDVCYEETLDFLETETTPKKLQRRLSSTEISTPKTRHVSDLPRRRSILKTPTSQKIQHSLKTPKKSVQLPDIVEEHTTKVGAVSTPKSVGRRRKSDGLSALTQTPKSTLYASNSSLSDIQMVRVQLHVSTVPASLPCREREFADITNFLESKLLDQCGGCMYISGVPGTGKTATVTGAINYLKMRCGRDEIPEFDFIEINGMRLTEPRQAYVHIYRAMTGKTVVWQQAHTLLENRFSTQAPRRRTTILLVDELDILCNRRQDVVYNLLDWPTLTHSRIVVITIANTMDLPERLLKGKVTSRLGLTRLTFQPYSHKQLQEIVAARLVGTDSFKNDAIQLVARKVAAVSGDARRALDICRRASEIAETLAETETETKSGGDAAVVSIAAVQQALSEMIASPKVQAIKCCSKMEQMFLQAVATEVQRTGIEETSFLNVYTQMESLAAFSGVKIPAPGRTLQLCARLGSMRLLICEHTRSDLYQKILLNVSTDDIHYALQCNPI